MKTKVLLSLALLALALAACNTKAPAVQRAWTYNELGGVYDLKELGELTFDGEHALINGRVLPDDLSEIMPHLTYGKDYNLLNFSDDALNAMSPEAAQAVIHASSKELNLVLSEYGISKDYIEVALRNDQMISLNEIYDVAQSLDKGLSAQSVGVTRSEELLQLLGLHNNLKGEE